MWVPGISPSFCCLHSYIIRRCVLTLVYPRWYLSTVVKASARPSRVMTQPFLSGKQPKTHATFEQQPDYTNPSQLMSASDYDYSDTNASDALNQLSKKILQSGRKMTCKHSSNTTRQIFSWQRQHHSLAEGAGIWKGTPEPHGREAW